MNIVQITPGAGAMYCGNCLRDNALVRTLRRMGHEVTMIPMYLPLTLDEPDESAGTPIFFSGISVYLEQQSEFFRRAPDWLHRWLSSRQLLKWAAGRAAKTRAADVGELTLSMLHGKEGKQAREIKKLISFLKTQPRADVICLSNLLLTGLVQPLKTALGTAVVCLMQGEDSFLDALPPSHQRECWTKVSTNAQSADRLLATSQYYADRMRDRLGIGGEKVRVVYSGIDLQGYERSEASVGRHGVAKEPVLGFFARMCREKGLDTLVDAFIRLRKMGSSKIKLRIGGSCGPSDQPVVNDMKSRLAQAGLLEEAEFHPNLTRTQKLEFLRSLSVFSVPARYGEAFGLYLVEAMAAGVPVVQPRTAAFPELLEASEAGLLCAPENPESLAAAILRVINEPGLAEALGAAGRRAAKRLFSVEAMASAMLTHFEEAASEHQFSSRVA